MKKTGLITSFFNKIPKSEEDKSKETIKKLLKERDEKFNTKIENIDDSDKLFSGFSRLMRQQLTPSQIIAFDLVRRGNNIFITGSAGTGKSFLISMIKMWAGKNGKKIAVTALTGAAAALIEGKTIHSWASVGLGKDTAEEYARSISKKWPAKMKWFKTDILVVDEVSMMDARFLDMLEELGRIIRRNHSKPFGGIQVILCGDFFQLPPVQKCLKINGDGDEVEDTYFCFEAGCWNRLISNTVELKEIMRQKDIEFAECLQKVRKGIVDSNVERMIENCSSELMTKKAVMKAIKPTRLYTTRASVDEINRDELKRLQKKGNEIIHYRASYGTNKKCSSEDLNRYIEIMDRDHPYHVDLYLAKDAQVMLLANLATEDGLVNGSRGVIVDFEDDFPVVQFMNGKYLKISEHEWSMEATSTITVTRRQIPLKLAWAITVHKSQGASLDCVELDIGSSIFEFGQTYVALSRVRSLEGLSILSFDPKKVMAHPKVVDFYEKIE